MMSDTDRAVAHARKALETARTRLADEIAAYPTPISGCDAQFNHLLAQRSQITRALEALDRDVFIPTPRTPAPQSGIESR